MVKKVSQRGVTNIRAAYGDAEAARRKREAKAYKPLDPNKPRFGFEAGKWPGAPHDNMPPQCPVNVLGHKGGTIYAMSVTGEIFEFDQIDLTLLTKLFSPYLDYLFWAWPGFGKAGEDEEGRTVPGKVKRVERDQAAMCLIKEGMNKHFDPSEQVRGRGGWTNGIGDFMWHAGQDLYIAGRGGMREEMPGQYDDFTYTVAKNVQTPAPTPVAVEAGPGLRILSALKTWNWERDGIDPLFFLGWIVTAYMSGALDWRPSIFVTGGAGVGKSSLHNLLIGLFGSTLFSTADTTAAGIYQRIKHDSVPIAIDEMENKPDSVKAQGILDLARIAASGDRMFRGGSNHEGTSFRASSSFAFFGINPPALNAASMSRMAILNLRRLDASQKDLEYEGTDADGRLILRRILDGWHDFQDRILPTWKDALQEAGLSARARNTYGTLLAAAELLIGDEAMAGMGFDMSRPAACGARVAELVSEDISQQTENWLNGFQVLLSGIIEAWKGGEKPTIGGTIDGLYQTNGLMDFNIARERLMLAGLGLKDRGKVCEGYALAVPYTSPLLNKILAGTEWQDGGWARSLRQGPETIVLRRRATHWINGHSPRVICIDLDAFRAFVRPQADDDTG